MTPSVFFCENCGKPVPLDAKRCPHCGSRFTAVQCPQCTFVGSAELFASGCPQCGFRANAPMEGEAPSEGPSRGGAATNARGAPAAPRGYRKPSRQLPGWFYTVASIFLLIVVIGLAIIILRLR